jgi:hypothetical protein
MCISKNIFYVYRWSQNKESYQAMERIKIIQRSPHVCKDFDLNYNQWNAYTRGAQVVGNKITLRLMEIFPNSI